jgi:serine phosphatase RsbU (regulator of sigma subunit)/anti-sigma regulatory factor (Ser/Thr protein kinase)
MGFPRGHGGGQGEPVPVEQAARQASFSMSVFDADQRYLWLNHVACEVMGLDEEALVGQTYPYGVPADVSNRGMLKALRDVVASDKPVHYESYTRAPSGIREHAWNLEFWPIHNAVGAVSAVGLAAFDSSEQHWARQRLMVLDEAAVSLGRSLDLVRTAQEFTELVVPRFADFASVDLLEEVLHGEEPTEIGTESVLLRRVAHLSTTEGAPEAVISLDSTDAYPPYSPLAQALHGGHTVLSGGSGEQDFDRWITGAPERARKMRGEAVTSMMAVPLIARGTTLGVAALYRTRLEEFNEDDYTLAKEITGRAALCVDNARRYARERITALALQASLLPQGPPRQSAVHVATRYRPADTRAGVGGDWFDIIPLSGARVGLVVGDVVGHGIQASATMGRLRTAVQTLADVDLPPDELLAHLDDLVIRIGGEKEAGEVGATCLFAVYDPIARRLTVASAGHPPPVVLLPDGSTRVLDISVGPVLGVGGLPFEALELDVPQDSLIALYSDGLVENTGHDPDLGIERLRQVLGSSDSTLEERCDQVLSAMLPAHPTDDVALVLARTRALEEDHYRSWDLAADPAIVAEARRLAVEQVADWGLAEASFVTELVVSELVTNAIRYGTEPIQLRLIHDRALICEVSDGNSTSPHLRRARITDEGGRGLLLVAQLTADWGTRHTATGKTIWAEQKLTPTP